MASTRWRSGPRKPFDLIAYWQQFGYHVGESGSLGATEAKALYGVESSLRSVRLLHQDSDHGLLRLMVWVQGLGDGLGLSGMKVLGGRWGAMLTQDVYAIVNHVEDAMARGMPVLYVEPQRQVIYDLGAETRPFLDPVVGVREMVLIQPETRQILFQRYGYDVPMYGKVNPGVAFPTSQITHAGIVIQGEASLTDFYERALGLLRARDGHVSGYDELASRHVFDMSPGETYVTTDFDDPRSVPSDLTRTRSGRLKIIRFPSAIEIEDLRDRSRPGHAGYSMYTYRVRDLQSFWRSVVEHGATEVTEIAENEFGEPSFSFVAPDGIFWNLHEE